MARFIFNNVKLENSEILKINWQESEYLLTLYTVRHFESRDIRHFESRDIRHFELRDICSILPK